MTDAELNEIEAIDEQIGRIAALTRTAHPALQESTPDTPDTVASFTTLDMVIEMFDAVRAQLERLAALRGNATAG